MAKKHFFFSNLSSPLKKALTLADHDCCKVPLFDKNVISIDPEKITKINYYINNQTSTPGKKEECNKENNIVQEIIKQNELEIVIEKTHIVYQGIKHTSLHKDIDSQIISGVQIIKVDLSFLEAPKPCGSNYFDVLQNTQTWHDHRRYKITGSRLPALLGFYDKAKYDLIWEVVKNGTTEPDLNHIKNIRRGHYFEDEAIKHFEKVSKAKIEKCGFFSHPYDNCYGSSPDGLGPSGILLEVKIRAAGSVGPINSLEKFPQYFVQCQLQMLCTDAEFCILQTYHPETNSSNFLLSSAIIHLGQLLKKLLIIYTTMSKC